jgi:hypothetical protein
LVDYQTELLLVVMVVEVVVDYQTELLQVVMVVEVVVERQQAHEEQYDPIPLYGISVGSNQKIGTFSEVHMRERERIIFITKGFRELVTIPKNIELASWVIKNPCQEFN